MARGPNGTLVKHIGPSKPREEDFIDCAHLTTEKHAQSSEPVSLVMTEALVNGLVIQYPLHNRVKCAGSAVMQGCTSASLVLALSDLSVTYVVCGGDLLSYD